MYTPAFDEAGIKSLGLEGKVEVFWSKDEKKYVTEDNEPVSLEPTGSPFVANFDYRAKYERFGNDKCYTDTTLKYVSLRGNEHIPEEFTHYCVGPSIEAMETHWDRLSVSIPIMFLKEK